MLPKTQRIGAKVHKNMPHGAKRVFSNHTLLRLATLSDDKKTQPLFSVVVSKKVEKTAVLRNSARRRIYSIIANIKKEKKIPPAIYIFSVNRSIKDISFEELREEIDFIIKKARI